MPGTMNVRPEHPRPKNDAETGVSVPESEWSFRPAARIPNSYNLVLATKSKVCPQLGQPLAKCTSDPMEINRVRAD